MVGKNWRDLFDMVIVQADKPNFFTDRRKYVSWGNTARLHGGLRFWAPFHLLSISTVISDSL